MRTCCSLPVALSLAVTSRMPLASMSNVTSICGMPRGAGGMPSRMNRPSVLLSLASSRSPWRTWISTCGWLSDAVEKTCVLQVGMVVLRSISLVITPPRVSMPSDSGVTSRSRTSLTSPARTPAWMAAPTATTSSGLTPLCGSLPPNISLTASTTAGMRVMPPTRMTSSMSAGLSAGVLERLPRPGPRSCSIRSATRSSSLARVRVIDQVLRARSASAVMNGRLISVDVVVRQLDLGLLGGLLEALEGHAGPWTGRCPGPS